MTKLIIDQLLMWELLKHLYYRLKVLRIKMPKILIDQFVL